MGTWSCASFGNDDACDWVAQLEEHEDFRLVESTLDALLAAGDGDIEAQQACEAIAAAEVLARARCNPGVEDDATSRTVDAWLARVELQAPQDLVDKARRVLKRIMRPPSELLELWEESDELDAWQASISELEARLGA